jgi:predicted dehydrogenase
MMNSRRKFLKKTSTAVASAGLITGLPMIASAGPRAYRPPSDRIRVGVIGCKGMGFSDIRSMLKNQEVECAALCDVDENILNARSKDILEMTGTKPKQYVDYRKMLDDKEIDAVIIGTPDHWHCLPMVDACEAGKDVYCEKPLANSIEECDIMMDAGKKHNRIVQVGMWQRSNEHFKNAIDFVHSGKLGRIRLVKVWAYMGWMNSIPVLPDQPAPEGVHYDQWLGPAPKRPFNPNRFHFNFRWYWDYAGGLMTDWGVHLIDIALWGMKAEAPLSVMASGGKMAYPEDAMETPDTLASIYEFSDHIMQWDHAVAIDSCNFDRNHGIAFIGNNGTLIVNRQGWEVVPEERGAGNERHFLMDPVPKHGSSDSGLDMHTKNFVECMKSRATPNCPVEIGGHTAKIAHLGNIAYRTGRKVFWDQASGKFKDDKEANQYLAPYYREPYQLPKVQ